MGFLGLMVRMVEMGRMGLEERPEGLVLKVRPDNKEDLVKQ